MGRKAKAAKTDASDPEAKASASASAPVAPAAAPATAAQSAPAVSKGGFSFFGLGGFGGGRASATPAKEEPPPEVPAPKAATAVPKKAAAAKEPKAAPKADAAAKSASAAPPKAEAKQPAKAPAKAASMPVKAATSPPKAEPAPKAPAKAKAAAVTAQASTTAAPGQASIPAKEKAAPKAKAAAAAAAAAAQAAAAQAAAAQQAEAAAKAAPEAKAESKKAKKKAAKEAEKEVAPPPPPEPEVTLPEEEPFQEADAKKKKRRNKNKKEAEEELVEEPAKEIVAPPVQGPTGAEIADREADKDAELIDLRKKLAALEKEVQKLEQGKEKDEKPIDAKELDKRIDSLSTEVDEMLERRRATLPKQSRQPSEKLAQSLRELEQAGNKEMANDVREELARAKATEGFKALKDKAVLIKTRCKELKEKVKANSAAAKGKGKDAKAIEKAEEKEEARREAAEKQGEEYLLGRLKEIHGKELNGDHQLHKKVLQADKLPDDIMKCLFLTETGKKLEKEYLVVLDTPRPSKGSGKGGKSAGGKGAGKAEAKELFVVGLSDEAVENCASRLKACGVVQKEVNNAVNAVELRKIEEECGVIATKNGKSSVLFFGTKKETEAAFAKAEAVKPEPETRTVAVPIDKEKLGYVQQQFKRNWNDDSHKTTRIRVLVNSEPYKILIEGKDPEVETARKEAEKILKDIVTKEVKVDNISKIERNSPIMRMLRDKYSTIINDHDKHVNFSPQKFDSLCHENSNNCVYLMGLHSYVEKAKADLQPLLSLARTEPAKVDLRPEQRKIIQERKEDIHYTTGAQVQLLGSDRSGDLAVVIYGDEDQVAKAKEEVQKVIAEEGTVETFPISDDAINAILDRKAAKKKEWETEFEGIRINIDRGKKQVSIIGPAICVKGAKKQIVEFAKAKEKEIADTTRQEITVDGTVISRIIGTQGQTLKKLKAECAVEVNIGEKSDDPMRTIEIKGNAEEVEKAIEWIRDIEKKANASKDREHNKEEQGSKGAGKKGSKGGKGAAPDSAEAAGNAVAAAGDGDRGKGKGRGKAAEFKTKLDGEAFPSLDGVGQEQPKARAPGGHWGARAAEKETKEAPQPQAEAYPELSNEAKTPVAAAKVATPKPDVEDPLSFPPIGEQQANGVSPAEPEEVQAQEYDGEADDAAPVTSHDSL